MIERATLRIQNNQHTINTPIATEWICGVLTICSYKNENATRKLALHAAIEYGDTKMYITCDVTTEQGKLKIY